MYKFFMLCLVLFLSACGNNLSVGDKVVVTPDYDEFRPGYIVGKVVALRNDKVTVDIKKFKDVDTQVYFDGLEKGDEEDFSLENVFIYDKGRAVASARKKFFKKIEKLDGSMSLTALMPSAKMLTMFMGYSKMSKKEKKITKKTLKEWKKRFKKIKLSAENISSLRDLAEEAKLKEWVIVVDILEVLSTYKENVESNEENLITMLGDSELTPPFEKFDEELKQFEEVYHSMAYIGEKDSSSRLYDFIEKVTMKMPMALVIHKFSLAELDSGNLLSQIHDEKKIVTVIGNFLNTIEKNENDFRTLDIHKLQIFNAYNDGGYDDRIEESQDSLDNIHEDMQTERDQVATMMLHYKLSQPKTYTTDTEALVVTLQQGLEKLGSSEESLEIDLSDLLDQAITANSVADDLREYHWSGTWDIKKYRRNLHKRVKISKVTFSPQVTSNFQSIYFSGRGKLMLRDKDGSNIQDFDMQLHVDGSETFQLKGGFGGGTVNCSFMDEQEIQCSNKNGNSMLVLITKDRKKEIKQELKQEKASTKKALKLEKKDGKKLAAVPLEKELLTPKMPLKPLVSVNKKNWEKTDSASWPDDVKEDRPAHVSKKKNVIVRHDKTAVNRKQTAQAPKKSVYRGVSSADARVLEKGIRTLTLML